MLSLAAVTLGLSACLPVVGSIGDDMDMSMPTGGGSGVGTRTILLQSRSPPGNSGVTSPGPTGHCCFD